MSSDVMRGIPSDLSFTPYNIVTGGATFERPVQYPKDGIKVFRYHKGTNTYMEIHFNQVMKEAFRNGEIITAEAYLKLVNEYNSKL